MNVSLLVSTLYCTEASIEKKAWPGIRFFSSRIQVSKLVRSSDDQQTELVEGVKIEYTNARDKLYRLL